MRTNHADSWLAEPEEPEECFNMVHGGSHFQLLLVRSLGPGDHLDCLLEVLLRAADITQRGVERVMTHDLREAMEWDHTRHLIAEPMP